MKIAAIVLVLWLVMNASPQIAEFEKQALASVQRRSASLFDDKLPRRPFGTWFEEIAGKGAGVVWQLSECGDPDNASEKEGDIAACAEANAVLANGGKIVVMILVGSFKKGYNGEPSFFGAVIEHKDQFYQVSRLRDLPRLVREPGNRPISLPGVTAKQALLKLRFESLPPAEAKYLGNDRNGAGGQQAPPAPPRKVEEVVVQGWAVTKVKPVYPANAKSMNAYGSVEVRIIISPEGKVIDATAISGHFALRSAAVEAARGWVFKPATIDGVPFNMESILTFVFARGSNK
jgi:TonB family protein